MIRDLAVEARMLVTAAGGRAIHGFVSTALCDLYGTTPDVADAWIDWAIADGYLHRDGTTLTLAGPLNGRRDTPDKAAEIRALWDQAHRDQTPAWHPEQVHR